MRDLYTKFKAMENAEILQMLVVSGDEEAKGYVEDLGYSESARENVSKFVKDYEDRLSEKNKKKKK
jgi:hypothetical protein